MIVAGAAVLVVSATALGAYINQNTQTKAHTEKSVVTTKTISKTPASQDKPWRNPDNNLQAQNNSVQQQPLATNCNDKNVLGYVAGAVAGGLAGNQLGKGNGKTVATIGGAVGGGYLGGKYIPLNNVTCK